MPGGLPGGGMLKLRFDRYITYLIVSLCKQVVRIGSVLSDPLQLTVGVAQGSILSPVLFRLYVNNLLSVPKKCEAMG